MPELTRTLRDDIFGSDDEDDEMDGDDEFEDRNDESDGGGVENNESTRSRPNHLSPVQIDGYVPDDGRVYNQPRAPFARTQWNGLKNAFERTDYSDTRRSGADPRGYIWVNRPPDLVGYRRSYDQTIEDEDRLAQQQALAEHRTADRNDPASFCGEHIPNAALVEISGYVSGVGRHAPYSWWRWLKAAFEQICSAHADHACAVGYEKGERNGHLHYQFVLRIYTEFEIYKTKIVNFIKRHLGILPGGGQKCRVQMELFRGQEWSFMLGYVQKDEGRTHYRFWCTSNITSAELEAGKKHYKAVSHAVHYVLFNSPIQLLIVACAFACLVFVCCVSTGGRCARQE